MGWEGAASSREGRAVGMLSAAWSTVSPRRSATFYGGAGSATSSTVLTGTFVTDLAGSFVHA